MTLPWCSPLLSVNPSSAFLSRLNLQPLVLQQKQLSKHRLSRYLPGWPLDVSSAHAWEARLGHLFRQRSCQVLSSNKSRKDYNFGTVFDTFLVKFANKCDSSISYRFQSSKFTDKLLKFSDLLGVTVWLGVTGFLQLCFKNKKIFRWLCRSNHL